jgi:hypothetical protein
LKQNQLVSGAQLQQAIRDLVLPEAPVHPVAKLAQVFLFLLDIFLSTAWMQELEQRRSSCRGQAKKSISPFGCENPIK